MTYFRFRNARATRGEHVYEGSTLLGRVALKRDWRSRLALNQSGIVDVYCATGLTGEMLPDSFPSRHDAAEALFALASGLSGEDEGTGARPT